MEGDIEDTVDLNAKYPSVTERYWTKYYFIPKDKKKSGDDGGDGGKGDSGKDGKGDVDVEKGSESVERSSESVVEGKGTSMEDTSGSVSVQMEVDNECVEGNVRIIGMGDVNKSGDGGSENVDGNVTNVKKEEGKGGNADSENVDGNARTRNHGKEDMKMEVENDDMRLKDTPSLQGKGEMRQGKWTYSSLDTSGHVCVMVHTNKLCLVTLSPKHPALAPGQKITEVSYNVGKFNRLDNQVSGKGKRGAQMMGPQSIVCIITCADGSRHGVLAGVHGKLVEVNERLVSNPQLLSERTDAEGYLAIILPPIRNGDAPLNRLITAQDYWAIMDQR